MQLKKSVPTKKNTSSLDGHAQLNTCILISVVPYFWREATFGKLCIS
jgi:hypothetical protein